jgi:hypothetical protein
MAILEYVRAYIDNLLVITRGSHDDHLDKLEQVFINLSNAGLKVNAATSFSECRRQNTYDTSSLEAE